MSVRMWSEYDSVENGDSSSGACDGLSARPSLQGFGYLMEGTVTGLGGVQYKYDIAGTKTGFPAPFQSVSN